MLYNKYRPKKLSEVIGNDVTLNSIKSLLKSKSFPHSVIFHGPSGCGKTTVVRIVRKYLKCDKSDYHEINAADLRGIDTIRDLKRLLYLQPQAESRVFVFDEAHQMSKDAQNALLKILEDSPSNNYFFLLTTEPDKLISTIRTRCTMFQFSPLNLDQMIGLIEKISKQEDINITGEIAELIFDLSQGSPRQALTLLEKLQGIDTNDQEKLLGKLGSSDNVIKLCRLLLDVNTKWKQIANLLKKMDDDVELVRNTVLSYFTTVLLNGENIRAYFVLDAFKYPFYGHKSRLVAACYEVVSLNSEEEDE